MSVESSVPLEFLWSPGGLIAVMITGLLAIVGIAVQKRKPRIDRQTAIITQLNSVIDQLQEERNNADERRREAIAARTEDAKAHAADVAALERLIRILQDYVNELRAHIADGKPPPPPAWPKGMTGDQ